MALLASPITTTTSSIYASAGNSAITSLTVCNYSPNQDVNINVYAVPNSQFPTLNNIILSNVLITPGDTLQLYVAAEKLVLSNGDAVWADSTANTVTTVVSFTSF